MRRILALTLLLAACSYTAATTTVSGAAAQTTTTAAPTTTMVPIAPLGIGVDDLANRWNAAAAEASSDRLINGAIPAADTADGYMAHTWTFTDRLSLEAISDGEEVGELILRLVPADSTLAMITDILTFLITVDSALEAESRGDILQDLVQLDGTDVDTEVTRNGIVYSMNNATGLTVLRASRP